MGLGMVSLYIYIRSTNPFTLDSLKWTLPSLNLDKSVDENRGLILKSKQNGKQCRFW